MLTLLLIENGVRIDVKTSTVGEKHAVLKICPGRPLAPMPSLRLQSAATEMAYGGDRRSHAISRPRAKAICNDEEREHRYLKGAIKSYRPIYTTCRAL